MTDQNEEKPGRQQTRRALQHLTARLRKLGRGSIGQVERGLNKKRNWLRDRRRSGKIELGLLLEGLHLARIDPVRFFHEVFQHDGHLISEPYGKQPALVTQALQCLTTPNRTVSRQHIDEQYLLTLDILRYDQPEHVLQVGDEIVQHLNKDLIPLFLGVMGSAWRILFQLDFAEHAIVAGIQTATNQHRGSLLRRLSYIIADRTEHHEALRISREATHLFAFNNDLAGIGRSFVDQGAWLYYLDRFQDSIATQKAALAYLPEEDKRHRFAVFQCMGFCWQRLGNSEQASFCVEQARSVADGVEQFNFARLLWLQGEIAYQASKFQEAERFFQETVAIFKSINPADTALVTIDLIRAQISQGNIRAACQTTTEMIALMDSLKKNKQITQGIMKLVRQSLEGKSLSIPLLDEIRSVIQTERERQHDRSRHRDYSREPVRSTASLM